MPRSPPAASTPGTGAALARGDRVRRPARRGDRAHDRRRALRRIAEKEDAGNAGFLGRGIRAATARGGETERREGLRSTPAPTAAITVSAGRVSVSGSAPAGTCPSNPLGPAP